MKSHRGFAVASLILMAGMVAACSDAQAIEDIEPGSTVTIRTEDGALVRGELAEVDPDTVVLADGNGASTRVERTVIQDVRTAGNEPASVEVVVPSGATLDVELGTTVASNASQVGDPIEATLTSPLMADGHEIAPVGSTLLGRVTEASPSGRVNGRAVLEVRFDRLRAGGVTHDITTDPIRYVAEATRGEDATKIGIGAGIGALVGGLAGGGKGAAIGSAVGAGGGTAVVLSTPGEDVRLTAGTSLDVRLARAFDAVVSNS